MGISVNLNAYTPFPNTHTHTIHRADYLHALDLVPGYLPARVNLAFLLQTEREVPAGMGYTSWVY